MRRGIPVCSNYLLHMITLSRGITKNMWFQATEIYIKQKRKIILLVDDTYSVPNLKLSAT
jgi:3-polyprenyl-4-hydroxybenzoate decarboxylase